MGDTGRDKFVRRNSTLEAIESLGASDLLKVKEHVDDDLLSCFLWAAGENAMNQSGWDVDEPKASALTSEIESGNILPQSLPDAAGTDFPSTIRSEPLVAGGGASSSGAGAAGAGAGAGGAAATPVAAAGGAAAAGAGATASGATPKAKRKGPGDDSDSDDDNSDDDDDNMLGPTGLPLTKEGKLLQRMQRKAESARIARLRKKDCTRMRGARGEVPTISYA
ncbi:hypothetical protein T492DRAFT_1138572 [Pavlovales sp. CCMP2436]|nr:hypothetical protein T492DRAFT_1138572 [Pavlovales sp. CCMP2436]